MDQLHCPRVLGMIDWWLNSAAYASGPLLIYSRSETTGTGTTTALLFKEFEALYGTGLSLC